MADFMDFIAGMMVFLAMGDLDGLHSMTAWMTLGTGGTPCGLLSEIPFLG